LRLSRGGLGGGDDPIVNVNGVFAISQQLAAWPFRQDRYPDLPTCEWVYRPILASTYFSCQHPYFPPLHFQTFQASRLAVFTSVLVRWSVFSLPFTQNLQPQRRRTTGRLAAE